MFVVRCSWFVIRYRLMIFAEFRNYFSNLPNNKNNERICGKFGRKLISSFVARISLKFHDPRLIFSPKNIEHTKWKKKKRANSANNNVIYVLYFGESPIVIGLKWNLVVQMNFQILMSVPAKCKLRKANKINVNIIWSYQVNSVASENLFIGNEKKRVNKKWNKTVEQDNRRLKRDQYGAQCTVFMCMGIGNGKADCSPSTIQSIVERFFQFISTKRLAFWKCRWFNLCSPNKQTNHRWNQLIRVKMNFF